MATDGDHLFQSELFLDRVWNSTGCGDAMLAGMAGAFLKGLSLSEIVRGGCLRNRQYTKSWGWLYRCGSGGKKLLPEIEVRSVNKEEVFVCDCYSILRCGIVPLDWGLFRTLEDFLKG